MAPSRRILFLPNGNRPSTNISTVNCSEWCSTGDCFNFCSPPFPPSPPSPPPIIVIPSPIPIEIIPKPPRHVPTIVIVIAAVLTTCFLLIYFSVLLSRRTSRRRRGLSTAGGFPPQPNNPDDDDDDDDGGEGETHHIWYIRTVGLDEPTINSITICAYRGGEGLIEGTDCSVCLSDFRDGELVRLLPKCNHAFHIPCIDTWLNSHVNCPLCRAPILASSSVAPANPSPFSSVAVPVETSSINENSNVPPSENNGLGSVEGVESGIGVSGVGIVVGSECSPPIVVSGSKAQSNLEEDLSRSKIDDPVALDVAADAGLQPVRRSVSMDSSSMDSLLFRVQPGGSSGVGGEEPNFDEEVATKNRVTLESCFKRGSLQKGPLEMERSLSSGGGLFFLSRYARGRKSILPL